MDTRKLEETLFKGFMIASLALVLSVLAGMILVIVLRGASSLSLSMLIQTPKGGYYLGKEGGIANAIVGSLYLAFGASLLSFLVGLPIAFALQKEYLGRRLAWITRLSLDILWGTPSIVYGAFGFIVMVYFGFTASLLGGIIALALLMLPIMTRSIEEVIRMIPPELKELTYALGATRIETTLTVVCETGSSRDGDRDSPCLRPRNWRCSVYSVHRRLHGLSPPFPLRPCCQSLPSLSSFRSQHPSLKCKTERMRPPSSC